MVIMSHHHYRPHPLQSVDVSPFRASQQPAHQLCSPRPGSLPLSPEISQLGVTDEDWEQTQKILKRAATRTERAPEYFDNAGKY